MGLFDSLVGQVASALSEQLGQGSEGAVMAAITHLLGSGESGGLSGLVQAFNENGLGDIVASWVGGGENLPISVEQIEQVIGAERLQALAEQFGLSPEALGSGFAEMLPQAVSKLTPDGVLPEAELVEEGLAFLKGKLFG